MECKTCMYVSLHIFCSKFCDFIIMYCSTCYVVTILAKRSLSSLRSQSETDVEVVCQLNWHCIANYKVTKKEKQPWQSYTFVIADPHGPANLAKSNFLFVCLLSFRAYFSSIIASLQANNHSENYETAGTAKVRQEHICIHLKLRCSVAANTDRASVLRLCAFWAWVWLRRESNL